MLRSGSGDWKAKGRFFDAERGRIKTEIGFWRPIRRFRLGSENKHAISPLFEIVNTINNKYYLSQNSGRAAPIQIPGREREFQEDFFLFPCAEIINGFYGFCQTF